MVDGPSSPVVDQTACGGQPYGDRTLAGDAKRGESQVASAKIFNCWLLRFELSVAVIAFGLWFSPIAQKRGQTQRCLPVCPKIIGRHGNLVQIIWVFNVPS